MTIGSFEDRVDEGADPPASGSLGRRTVHDDVFPDPTAGMVLHRMLAMSARTFLLNELGDELETEGRRTGTIDALQLSMGTRPLWAQSAVGSLAGTERRTGQLERTHQTRVAMRRIRSNLRTFRLLFDSSWGTSLRAELAWYGNELGRSRDLDLLAKVVTGRGPEVLDATEVARMVSIIHWRREAVAAELAIERAGPRRFALTEQMMLLWDGPHFRAKAARPATDVLPDMVRRSWQDLRGASRTARKDPSDAHLHRLRIRLKDLRYAAETMALVEEGPARKTARAAERLQGKLGDLHDVAFTIAWLRDLATDQPDLADAAQRLVAAQRVLAGEARRGWKREFKEVERRWRRWHG